VGRFLRRRPVAEVVGDAGMSDVTETCRPEVAVHQSQLVARRQEPPVDAIHAEGRTQRRGDSAVVALAEDLDRVLPAGANRRRPGAGNEPPETAPLRTGTLIE